MQDCGQWKTNSLSSVETILGIDFSHLSQETDALTMNVTLCLLGFSVHVFSLYSMWCFSSYMDDGRLLSFCLVANIITY